MPRRKKCPRELPAKSGYNDRTEVQTLKSESMKAKSRKETSDLDKAKMEVKLQHPMEKLAGKHTSSISLGTQTTLNMSDLHNTRVYINELTARVRQLDDLLREKENIINDLKRQQEQAESDLSQKDKAIKCLEMKLDAHKNCTNDAWLKDATVIQVANDKNHVPCINSTNLEDINSDEWEDGQSEENSVSKEEPMTEELCGEICDILYQLRRGSFTKSLNRILAMPLTNANIEAFAFVIHDMAMKYPSLSEFYANLSDRMMHKLPTETSTKMRTFLMKRCQELSMCPNVDPDTQVMAKDIDEAGSPGEKKLLREIYNKEQRRREECINNARFIGELWKAGSIETRQIHKYISKLLDDRDELSLKCLYSILKTVGEHLEENEDLSNYFNSIQRICRTSKNISTLMKLDLQNLVELRNKQWNGEIY
jgi:hypothetical protein